MAIITDLAPIVEGTVKRLSSRAFSCDPLMGADLSRITSVVSSAYKRHGHILEASIRAALAADGRFIVWTEPTLPISQAAESLATSYMSSPTSALSAGIQHEIAGHRTLQIDMFVYDTVQKTISAYEVKRGAGAHDAGKRRSMLRDLLCTQVVLRSYAEKILNLEVRSAHSYVIIYCGAESLGKPFTLTREDLNDHFGCDIVGQIEEVNAYYRSCIENLLQTA